MSTVCNEFNFWGDWGAWFSKLISSLLLLFVQFCCNIIFFLEQVFWTLARGIKQNDGTYKTIFDYLIFNDGDLSSLKSNSLITNIIVYMMIIGVFLTILAMIIALIKYQLSIKDEDQNPKIVIMGVIKAILLIIAFPFCIVLMLKISNALVDSVCTYANIQSGEVNNSLANKLYLMFGNYKPTFYDANGNALFSFINNKEEFIKAGLQNTSQDNGYLALIDMGFINNGVEGYQYLLALIVCIIVGYGILKCLLLLAKRIFDMTLLYIVAPLTISTYPADDGKRYGVWKDLMIAKIMLAFGMAVGFIIYMIFIQELSILFKDLDPLYFGHLMEALSNMTHSDPLIRAYAIKGATLTGVYIIIVISGSLSLPTIYQMIATLVSETAGHQASSDLANVNSDLHTMGRLMAFGHHLGHDAVKIGKTTGGLLYSKGGQNGKARGLLAPAINAKVKNSGFKKEDKVEALKKNILENYNSPTTKKQLKEYRKMTGQKLTAKDALNYQKEKDELNVSRFRNDIHQDDSKAFKKATDKYTKKWVKQDDKRLKKEEKRY